MTREEFFTRYATRSGTTVERLRELGGIALSCQCEYPKCQVGA